METSICVAGEPRFWHLYWQAAPGRDLLADSRLIEQIKTRLARAHATADRELIYYLLLPREIHLISRLREGDSLRALTSGMINVIARHVRDAQGSFGPVFAGRYQARRIDGVEALGNAIRMLAWRPVATGIREVPTSFHHSALRTILGIGLPAVVDGALSLAHFGRSVPQARQALRSLLARKPSKLELLQWELAHGLAFARGMVGPFGRMQRPLHGAAAILVVASEPPGIDGALKLLESWVKERLRLHVVQDLATCKGADGTRGRALVGHLAVRLGLCSASYVARHFRRSKATLSEQMSKSSARAADRVILSLPMDRVVQEAIAITLRAAEHRLVHRIAD
jgi:hypothetical protein